MRACFLEIEKMGKQKSNLEVVKFKREFMWLMIVTGREDEASDCLNEALKILQVEIENEREVA
tara:strand:- start:129 stop:317 length:189 start_codon:yes stop_codon:yes gene_type:complete